MLELALAVRSAGEFFCGLIRLPYLFGWYAQVMMNEPINGSDLTPFDRLGYVVRIGGGFCRLRIPRPVLAVLNDAVEVVPKELFSLAVTIMGTRSKNCRCTALSFATTPMQDRNPTVSPHSRWL